MASGAFVGEAVLQSWVNFRCSSAQSGYSVSRSMRAAVSLIVYITVDTGIGGSKTLAVIIEPSSWTVGQGVVTSCGYQQAGGWFFPPGVGFDDSAGIPYNLIDTGLGQCT